MGVTSLMDGSDLISGVVRRRPRPSLSIGRSVSERAREGVAVVAVVSVSRTNKRDHKPRASASE